MRIQAKSRILSAVLLIAIAVEVYGSIRPNCDFEESRGGGRGCTWHSHSDYDKWERRFDDKRDSNVLCAIANTKAMFRFTSQELSGAQNKFRCLQFDHLIQSGVANSFELRFGFRKCSVFDCVNTYFWRSSAQRNKNAQSGWQRSSITFQHESRDFSRKFLILDAQNNVTQPGKICIDNLTFSKSPCPKPLTTTQMSMAGPPHLHAIGQSEGGGARRIPISWVEYFGITFVCALSFGFAVPLVALFIMKMLRKRAFHLKANAAAAASPSVGGGVGDATMIAQQSGPIASRQLHEMQQRMMSASANPANPAMLGTLRQMPHSMTMMQQQRRQHQHQQQMTQQQQQQQMTQQPITAWNNTIGGRAIPAGGGVGHAARLNSFSGVGSAAPAHPQLLRAHTQQQMAASSSTGELLLVPEEYTDMDLMANQGRRLLFAGAPSVASSSANNYATFEEEPIERNESATANQMPNRFSHQMMSQSTTNPFSAASHFIGSGEAGAREGGGGGDGDAATNQRGNTQAAPMMYPPRYEETAAAMEAAEAAAANQSTAAVMMRMLAASNQNESSTANAAASGTINSIGSASASGGSSGSNAVIGGRQAEPLPEKLPALPPRETNSSGCSAAPPSRTSNHNIVDI